MNNIIKIKNSSGMIMLMLSISALSGCFGEPEMESFLDNVKEADLSNSESYPGAMPNPNLASVSDREITSTGQEEPADDSGPPEQELANESEQTPGQMPTDEPEPPEQMPTDGSEPPPNNPERDFVLGLDKRPENKTCLATAKSTLAASKTVVFKQLNTAFDGVTPREIEQLDSLAGRWYVLDENGVIRSGLEGEASIEFTNLKNFPICNELKNLSGKTSDHKNELVSLQSMAFHPDFANNGYVFLAYTIKTNEKTNKKLYSLVSRFTSLDNGMSLDPTSQKKIFSIATNRPVPVIQKIDFGPDGFLYLGVQDDHDNLETPTIEASAANTQAQNIASYYGKLLRIDVNTPADQPYAIPDGNPFRDSLACSDTGCPEIYALGFYDPRTWSFDRKNNDLFMLDFRPERGSNFYKITAGGNYGWGFEQCPITEEADTDVESAAPIEPLFSFYDPENPETNLAAIQQHQGGFVYHGNLMPWLANSFIFSAKNSGQLLALTPGRRGDYSLASLSDKGLTVQAWMEDARGELYLATVEAGIDQLKAIDLQGPDYTSKKLSETGCINMANPQSPMEGLVPYEVIQPFWSNGAEKNRYIALPDGGKATIDEASGDVLFPQGTVLVKNFMLNNELIETRLFMHHFDGVWGGYAYIWNDEKTDADLVIWGGEKTWGGTQWHYPGGDDCMSCHTKSANFSLSAELAQLNRKMDYPNTPGADQLPTLDAIGYFDKPLDLANLAAIPTLVNAADADQDITLRVKSYLHANCSGCHVPSRFSDMDFRFTTPLASMAICDVVPDRDLGIVDARIIAPGDPARSTLLERVKSLKPGTQMPPLHKTAVDQAAVALITEWILGLKDCGVKEPAAEDAEQQ